MDHWKRLCPSHLCVSKRTTRPNDHQHLFTNHCQVAHTKTEGDYIVAQKTIPEGTLILQEDPSAYQIHSTLNRRVCSGCLKSLNSIKHPTPCRQTSCSWKRLYCSSTCETNEWFKIHAYVCAFYSSISPSLLLAFELWTQGANTSLVSNLDQHSASDLATYHQGAMFLADLFHFSIHDTRAMKQDLVRQQGIIRCNGFGIQRKHIDRTVTMDTIATAIYPLASKFNHSCQPNVLALFLDGTLQLRTLRPVQSGQSLCISYGPLAANMPRLERSRVLQDHYFFKCTCQACQGVVPDPSLPPSIDQIYKCPHCHDQKIELNTLVCPQCHSVIDWNRIQKVEKAIKRSLGDWEKVLQLQQSIYHDKALVVGKTYDQLARFHHLSQRSTQAIHCCERSLSIVQSVYGQASPEAAEEMFKLCGLYVTGNYDRNKAKEWIRKTRDMYRRIGLDQQLKDDIDELEAMDRLI